MDISETEVPSVFIIKLLSKEHVTATDTLLRLRAQFDDEMLLRAKLFKRHKLYYGGFHIVHISNYNPDVIKIIYRQHPR